MHILDKILKHKIQEVEEKKELYPVKLLERSIHFDAPTISIASYIQRPDKSGIIAEYKRRSPSKGVINGAAGVERTTIGYMQAGASALSVLTDEHFFGGKSEDLLEARKYNYCPILRKDFVVDEYQILEAKAIGADAILLIAAALAPERLAELSRLAKELKLEVLMEVHTREELLSNLHESIDLIGVNNRNLKTFEVSLQTSLDLSVDIPDSYVKISESGIRNAEDIQTLKSAGFQGFLMGESFMKHRYPESAARKLIEQLN